MNNSCYAFRIYTFYLHFCPIRIEFILLIDSEYFISFIWVWVFMLDNNHYVGTTKLGKQEDTDWC